MAMTAAAAVASKSLHQLQTHRFLTKVRLKWVKNRGLDHIIDRDTDIKAAVLLKDAILRSPSSLLSSRSLAPLQKPLGLTVPVLRFLRRYPTLFLESPHPRFPVLPSFSLSPAAHLLHRRECQIHSSNVDSSADTLSRLLLMSRSKSLPVSSLFPLRYDLGLPDDFLTSVVSAKPHVFDIVRRRADGLRCVSLAPASSLPLPLSSLQKANQSTISDPSYRDFKRNAASPFAFPSSFPRGYGSMKKVKAWMDEFHRLPYISPYEDASGIDPESDLMEKRVVGVLHELLSLTLHRKTKRNYLRCLREELDLPHRFTRVFTRYPGIFYLSLKCKTTTVMLREGYRRGKLVDPHPLAALRDKYYYVMRTGVLYRGKGLTRLVLDDDDDKEECRDGEDGTEEIAGSEDDGSGDEFYEMDSSDIDGSGSDGD